MTSDNVRTEELCATTAFIDEEIFESQYNACKDMRVLLSPLRMFYLVQTEKLKSDLDSYDNKYSVDSQKTKFASI